tara:strand:+ start:8296 stop:8466 length:171 start_codon:yes stop_codon:yes gene_type:complete
MFIYDKSGKIIGKYVRSISLTQPDLSGYRKLSGDGPHYIDSSEVRNKVYIPFNGWS